MEGFKLWVEQDHIDRTIQGTFGNIPSWISKDLFRDNWLKQQAKKGTSRTPFSDWMNNPRVQAFRNVTWDRKPTCIQVKPTDFHEETLSSMVVRKFGKNPIQLRNMTPEQDAQKTKTQCDIMAKTHDCGHAPVIVVLDHNKYRLLEGWHRTMCKLLGGATPEALQLLENPKISNMQLWNDLQLDSWKPIQLHVYIGRYNIQPQHIDMYSPTGDYSDANTPNYTAAASTQNPYN